MNLRLAFLPMLPVWLMAVAHAQDADSTPKLAPPYPELTPTFWEQYGNAVILCGIVFVALVAVGVWLGLRKSPAAPEPPEVRAQNEMRALQAVPEDGVVLSQVSQALRRYFVAAFGLPPGEYTTAEFCRLINGNEKIGVELAASVAAFLQEADERKFAANPVKPADAAKRALDLVERSEALRRPPSVKS